MMIDFLVEFSARHRKWIVLVTAIACICGWFAMSRVPLDVIPDLSETQVIVASHWDRDPGQMEDQVTNPIVTALTGRSKVKTVRAISDFSYSYVYVIFDEDTDLFWARTRVQEVMATVIPTLPTGVTTSLGPDATSLGWIFQYALVDKTGTHNPAELRSIQDWYLRSHLRSVRGVSEVASVGGFGKEYQVNVDPVRLRNHDLGIVSVAEALRNANTDTGARLLESNESESMLRGSGYLKSIHDIENSVISASTTGTSVRVGDIAQVVTGPNMRRGVADLDGRGETVSGIIVMRNGESVPEVIDRVKSRLEEIKPGLPAGVEVIPIYDRSRLIEQSISHLRWTLIEIIVTVAVVILVFLWHIPSAVIPILTIPAALLISFIPFYGMGLTANIMSLGGLAIAVGALVDASIVVVEQTHLKLGLWESEGKHGNQLDVMLKAIKEVARPSFFALLIIALAFLPVFTLQGEEGKLFRPLAYTKTFAMIVGAVLAITFDPAIRVMLMKLRSFRVGPDWIAQRVDTMLTGILGCKVDSGPSRFLSRTYEPIVRWTLSNRLIVVVCTILLGAVSMVVASHLGSEFMPRLEEGVLLYMPSTSPGISITEAKRLLQATDEVLASMPEVEHVLGKAGRADTATDPAPLSMFETLITLKPQGEWPRVPTWYSAWAPHWLRPVLRHITPDYESLDQVTARMDKKLQIPGLANAWTMPVKGRIDMQATGIRTPLGVKIMGADPAMIGKISVQVSHILETVPGARHIFSERVSDGSYVDVVWNRDELARYGITIEQAQHTFASAVGGEDVSQIIEGREHYPVNVRYMRDYRSDLNSLRHILIPTSIPGRQIPLGSLAVVQRRTGPSMIRNEDGLITGYVYVDLAGTDIGHFVSEGNRALKKLGMPIGYSLRWDGQFEAMQRVNRRLSVVIPITLVLVFMLLRFATGSLIKSSIVFLAVPFSAIGAFLLLGIMNYSVSVAVWVGLIALLGVDAETGIFMLLYLDLAFDERSKRGRMRNRGELHDAIVEGAARRIRPKVMTVAAMLIGLIPILWSSGPGAEIMKHIAVPMIGGITTSFLLELMVYPLIYEARKWSGMKEESSSELLSTGSHPHLNHGTTAKTSA